MVSLAIALIHHILYSMTDYEKQAARKAGAERQSLPAPGFPEIKSLEEFSWKDEEPLKLRLFKPKYHLTMGTLRDCLFYEVLWGSTNFVKCDHMLM